MREKALFMRVAGVLVVDLDYSQDRKAVSSLLPKFRDNTAKSPLFRGHSENIVKDSEKFSALNAPKKRGVY